MIEFTGALVNVWLACHVTQHSTQVRFYYCAHFIRWPFCPYDTQYWCNELSHSGHFLIALSSFLPTHGLHSLKKKKKTRSYAPLFSLPVMSQLWEGAICKTKWINKINFWNFMHEFRILWFYFQSIRQLSVSYTSIVQKDTNIRDRYNIRKRSFTSICSPLGGRHAAAYRHRAPTCRPYNGDWWRLVVNNLWCAHSILSYSVHSVYEDGAMLRIRSGEREPQHFFRILRSGHSHRWHSTRSALLLCTMCIAYYKFLWENARYK